MQAATTPWFTAMGQQFAHIQATLSTAKRNLSKYRPGSRIELEGRIGTLHPQTKAFIPGVLTKADAEPLIKQCGKMKEQKVEDVYYKNGMRLRNGTVLIRKIVFRSWTFLCSNGFVFRISVSIEEPQDLDVKQETISFQRSRQRISCLSANRQWNYDFTQEEPMTEIEVEYIGASYPTSTVTELAYRLAHIVRCLRPGPVAGDLAITQTLSWPIESYLV